MRTPLFALCLVVLSGSAAWADDTNGTLWYTTFSGGTNVHRVDYSWVDSSSTLSFSNNTGLASVAGADGILFLPNGNLAIGGQGPSVHEVTPAGTLVTTLAGLPSDSYHLSLSPAGKVLYSASIPGGPTAITLNGSGGLLGASFVISPISGSNTTLDTIAFVTSGPNAGKSYYTESGGGGGGVVGSITFTPGPEAPAASLVTTSILALPASHGMVYDPFSDSIITMGANQVSRFSSAGVFLETLTFAGAGTFDQGTVDGNGHIFAADNNGNMTFIDYSASGTLLAGSTKFGTTFLAASLDDIAPKVGTGSNNGVPEVTSLITWTLLSLFGGVGVSGRRKRA